MNARKFQRVVVSRGPAGQRRRVRRKRRSLTAALTEAAADELREFLGLTAQRDDGAEARAN